MAAALSRLTAAGMLPSRQTMDLGRECGSCSRVLSGSVAAVAPRAVMDNEAGTGRRGPIRSSP